MLFRKKTLWAKVESTYGTDPTPTGASNAILTSNLQIQPYNGPVVSRNNDREVLGSEQSINTNPQVQITFGVEIAGAGSAGSTPLYDPLLRAVGWTGAQSSPATSYVYSLVSESFESVTFYFYHDGQRHVIKGARGNMSVSLTRGEIPRFQFTFIGQYTRPTSASPSGTDVSGFVAPVPVTNTNTPTFTLGGSPLTNLVAESFTFDMGNQVVARNVINNEEIMITNRAMTGNIIAEAPAISTKNWFTPVESHSSISAQVLNLVHGTTAGNIVEFDAPSVQLATIAQNDSDGLVVYNFGAQYVPSSSGNDEMTLTIR